MAKRPNAQYVEENQRYLQEIRDEDDTLMLSKGVMYKIINSGEGEISPNPSNVITVHYRGTMIFGQEFDSTLGSHPESFRLRDVIEGWQIALTKMRVGDRWKIYIPSSVGYGDRDEDDIPAGSTLIFDVELLAIN